jgi:FkbM family methyltransferase
MRLKDVALLIIPPIKRLHEDRDRLALALATQQPMQKLLALMRRRGVDLVLDIGANAGQFASLLRATGFHGKIISFEPLSTAFAALKCKCDQDAEWSCHNIAIGNTDGEATINISANSQSSSLLPVRGRTVEIEPSIAYIAQESVELHRLDSLLPELTDAQRIFLKVDTQGFERNVVEGSRAIFNRIAMVQLELAWTPSYEGQAEMGEMLGLMRGLGFEPALVWSTWTDEATGLMPEIDVVFIKPSGRGRPMRPPD